MRDETTTDRDETVHAALRVLIAYDGSPSAATAVRAGASLFPTAQAYVTTVPSQITMPADTTFPGLPTMSPDAVQQAYDQLGAAAQRQAHETAQEAVDRAQALGLQAEIAPAGPSPRAWAALLETAGELSADVLVSGTRGRGAFARALLGSTSTSLLHHADLPLLLVPDGAGELDGPVIAAYDGSEGAKHAIAAIGRLLGRRPVIVVHTRESAFQHTLPARAFAKGPIDDLREIVWELERALAESADETTQEGVAIARAAGLDATGETIESAAGAWRSIAAAARTHEAAVIATGTRGLGGARSALLGSVSSGLVQNAELPVLVAGG
jgi:nucleotide-binding universal stress UspA family protein